MIMGENGKNSHGPIGKIRKPITDENKSNKRTKLDVENQKNVPIEKVAQLERTPAEILQHKIQSNFSFLNSKTTKEIRGKKTFESPYPEVPQKKLALIYSDYLPNLRNQIDSLKEIFGSKILNFSHDEVFDKSVIELPGNIESQIIKIGNALESLTSSHSNKELDPNCLVSIHESRINLADQNIDQLSVHWSSLAESCKTLLNAIATSSAEEIKSNADLGKIRSKSDECLRLVDLIIKNITHPDRCVTTEEFKLLSQSLNNIIESEKENLERLLKSEAEESEEKDEEDEDEEDDFRDSEFLKPWLAILSSFKSMIDKVLSEDSKVLSKLTEDQLQKLGHEFREWTSDFWIDVSLGYYISDQDNIGDVAEKLLESIKVVQKIFFVLKPGAEEVTPDKPTYNMDEFEFEANLYEVEVDKNDEFQVWLEDWIDQLLPNLHKSYKAMHQHWGG
ncbi:hypothetical protein BY996DRAFT_7191030 [Phakopsora pachyrhizi]|nr:hypothetical protein BY996DRAFT_7191030 [Phakopsora pachyrhizi]